MADTYTEVDLTVDDEIYGQKFMCVSYVMDSTRQKCDMAAVKIRGSYTSEDEARRRAKHLQKVDPNFDIFVAPVGVWLPLVNSTENIPVEYANEQLNDIIKGYKENQEKQKEIFDKRKSEMVAEAKKLSSEELRLERTKQSFLQNLKEVKLAEEHLKDLNQLKESFKESLKTEYNIDVDALATEAEAPTDAPSICPV